MSGKRAKQLKKVALKQINSIAGRQSGLRLDTVCINGKGEPNLFRQIKKDYINGRIDRELRPI